MRSALPKVLHPLCGRPLIAWPVEAAREAGAGRVIVVDNPKRRLEDHLPDGVEVAIQKEPNGTGDAVAAAASLLDPTATVVVINGDVALLTGEAIAKLIEAHDAAGAAATMATMELDEPGAYGRVIRGSDGSVLRVAEAKAGAGDATPEELEIREVNAGVYAFDGGALIAALQTLSTDNAQGELYLPDVLPAIREAGRGVAAHPIGDPDLTHGDRRPRRPRLRPAGRAAPHPRAPHAQRRHDRRPEQHADRRHGHDRQGHDDRAVHPAHGRHADRRRHARRRDEHADRQPDRRRRHDPALPPHAGARGRRRHGRAVRLPAAGRPSAPEGEGRHLRRDQELRDRRRDQGPAPLVHRRRRRRRGDQHRRRQHHRQLRRPQQAPDDDRLERQDQRRHGVRGAGHGRRQRLHRGRQRHHRGRPRGGARDRPRAPEEHRGLRRAQRAAERTRRRPPLVVHSEAP